MKVYSLSGELLQTYGTWDYGDVGYFRHAVINEDEDDGSVLIADQVSSTLQVMTEQGEFSALQLQPPVSKPRSAVLFNNQLYITSWHGELIKKYSC